ncbi:MAG: FimV/HubP family polar landmark protein [Pseudomonadota bacterium]
MHRWFAAVFVAVALLASHSAVALGLGDIKTESALNEPMQAEIALLGATRDELTTLEVRLASAETFERYGIEKAAYLNGLRFRVRGGAQPTVEITSSQPITEPFVTMLIEAVWPRGRLLREYTVLLDPPTYAAPVSAAPAPARRTTQQPARASANAGNIQRSAPATSPARNRSIDGTEYRVQRRDTLWEIARDIQPDQSVSINQVMVAIFEANPSAFDGNINRLKAGAVLALPSRDALFAINKSNALQEVQRQNRDWRGGGSGQLVLTKPDEDVSLGGVSGGSTGTPEAGGTAVNAELARLQSELREKERLIAVRNQELAELQARLGQAAEVPAPESVADPEPVAPVDPATDGPYADTGESTDDAPITAGEIFADDGTDIEQPADDIVAEEPAAADEPTAAETPRASTTNVVVVPEPQQGMLPKLLNSTWVWLAAGAAIILGLFGFVASRRNRDNDPTGTWEALDAADLEDLDGTLAATGRLRDISASGDTQRSQVIDESLARDAMEMTAPVDETLPPVAPAAAPVAKSDATGEFSIEDTFSSDTAINFDQSDPLKEADFHMAYGLFDQAADLVKGAINVDSSDPALRAKLCEIYFQWGNQDGFVEAASELRGLVDDSDPSWNKVVIMGQQLAPANDMFSGAVISSDGGDLDLSFDSADGGDIDSQLGDGEQTGGFTEVFENTAGDGDTVQQPADISGIDFEFDDSLIDEDDTSTSLAAVPGNASGSDLDFDLDAQDDGDGTVEQIVDLGDDDANSNTDEIDIAGLDLSSDTTNAMLDSMTDLGEEDLLAATGATSVLPDDYQVSLPEDPEATVLASTISAPVDGGDLDLTGTNEMEDLTEAYDDAAADDDLDATGVMPAKIEDPSDIDLDINDLTSELRVDDLGALEDATMEQPVVDASPTAFSEEVFSGGDADSNADTGLNLALDDDTNVAEVGTKLDLARAYVDMGDPEGARSILGEVLSEGDDSQREEAQALLDSLS